MNPYRVRFTLDGTLKVHTDYAWAYSKQGVRSRIARRYGPGRVSQFISITPAPELLFK